MVLKKWMILMGCEVELRLCLFGGNIKSWGREEFGRVEGGKERELEGEDTFWVEVVEGRVMIKDF